ncbi:MAG: DUF4157 domain-containing protein [Chloroflexi bacterium]|nr:DUF4157 domain-containing protein [Chloroflexota bacterium]MCI0579258.1 DUF4157 domain-containing protein [Chloroflexota bacterium]MCI0649383.1 DUF4157 domain-containing protein [Chloroflexota bacterium]MCI0727020.1 DUF4157 domain-containing protein [Chloroflexota bacterium]
MNLARDFSRRAGRLAGTVATPPAAGRPASVAAWLHALLCRFFDLAGGPEVAQFFIRLVTHTSPLTEVEIAAAAAVLGLGAVRYRQVRVAEGGVWRLAFKLNKNRAFATWHTVNLPPGRRSDLSLLVHELAHVYQYERVGTVYIGQGLSVQARLGRQAYDYGGPAGLATARAAGKRYWHYNREQQGQIAQDYFRRLQSGADTVAYEPFIAELRAGQL